MEGFLRKDFQHPQTIVVTSSSFVVVPQHIEIAGDIPNLCIEKNNKAKFITMVSGILKDPLFNNLEIPVLDINLINVHPVLRNIFRGLRVPKVPLRGRLKMSLEAWKKLTKDQDILSRIEKGYQIPFKTNPV